MSQRQAYAAEADDELREEPEPDDPATEHEEHFTLEEVLQAEAEILATEIEEAVDDGIGADLIQDVEDTVESAAEALLTMREARTKLAEVRKDRGYGKASPTSSTSSPSPKSKLASKKGKTPCFDCNQLGHWAGDAECPKPGAGLGRKGPKQAHKSVKVVETLNTEHLVGADHIAEETNETLTVSCVSRHMSLKEALNSNHTKEVLATGLSDDKRLVGALDSACNRTVSGSEWLQCFLRGLESAPQHVRELITTVKEHEVFRFGDGGTQVSVRRWRIPTMIGGTLVCIWVSEVPVPSLGLLLGRDFLESVGATMSFASGSSSSSSLTRV